MNSSPPKPATLTPVFRPILLTLGNSIIFEYPLNIPPYPSVTLSNEPNFIQNDSFKLPKKNKYEIYFPENVRKNSIDEYLFFIGSKKKINWLNKYSKFEDLKKQFINSKSLVKWKYKEYTIIK